MQIILGAMLEKAGWVKHGLRKVTSRDKQEWKDRQYLDQDRKYKRTNVRSTKHNTKQLRVEQKEPHYKPGSTQMIQKC